MRLIAAVESWMEYMRIVVKSEHVIVEHSMCQPISDYLERLPDVNFELEKGYDILAKKRVDVYWKYNNTEEVFMELKIAEGYSAEKLSDIFDDLCRLSLLLGNNKSCYFMLSGETESFETLFYNTQKLPKRKHKICEWLSLDQAENKKERTIQAQKKVINNRIRKSNRKILDCYKAFLQEYDNAFQVRNNGQTLANNMQPFKTRLIHYNNYNKMNKSKNSIALWEIYRD